MKYERAKKSDLPALTRLWMTCFGDKEADIWEFWRLFDRISVFIARDKAPIAMLCALPVTLFDECGEAHGASYLYAVCTAPSHRRKGICARLMSFAESELTEEFALLVPASKELFAFYEKLGYQTAFYNRQFAVSAAATKAKITKISADAYRNLRQMQLYANFVDYDEALLALHDGLYRIETAEAVCCAVAEVQEHKLVIKELLPYDEAAVSALAAHLSCACAEARTEGADFPFGMAKSLTDLSVPEHAYLGLAFD